MNRRHFMKSGMAAVASAPFRSTAQRPTVANPTGADFDFTGLFAFRIVSKQLRVFLVDAKQSKMKDLHTPALMMPFEDYEPDRVKAKVPDDIPYVPPTIVRIGANAMALWSLFGNNLWVYDAHTSFEAIVTGQLTYDDTPIDPTMDPNPIAEDKGWSSIHWFPQFERLLGGAYELGKKKIKVKKDRVAGVVRLVKGYTAGRAPKLVCEQMRKHTVDGGPPRTFATQMHVTYEHPANSVLLLGLSDGSKMGIIGVKIRSNYLSPISVMNMPLTHFDQHHYKGVYTMVGASGKEIDHLGSCYTQMERDAFKNLKTTKAGDPNSPDPDCIPPATFEDE